MAEVAVEMMRRTSEVIVDHEVDDLLENTTKKYKLPYSPSLDGIRTFCVTFVVFFHLEWSAFRWGYLGVDVFFTLSGFLITSLLVSELYQTNSISLNDFWARRIRRLMPGAVLLVIFVAWTIASRNCFVDLLFNEGTDCSQSVYYHPRLKGI